MSYLCRLNQWEVQCVLLNFLKSTTLHKPPSTESQEGAGAGVFGSGSSTHELALTFQAVSVSAVAQ